MMDVFYLTIFVFLKFQIVIKNNFSTNYLSNLLSLSYVLYFQKIWKYTILLFTQVIKFLSVKKRF